MFVDVAASLFLSWVAITSANNLPAQHLIIFNNAFPGANEPHLCSNELHCNRQQNSEHNESSTSPTCWGYELGCLPANRYAGPAVCTASEHTHLGGQLHRKADVFFEQADFGYVRQQTRELQSICEPHYSSDSSLECSGSLRFCRARGIRVDFGRLVTESHLTAAPFRYRTDVLGPGQIGGRCRLHRDRLTHEMQHLGALQSWAPELQHFVQLPDGGELQCDVWIDRPTFIVKIDSAYNMYHHFCDFFNLYVSLHVNATHPDAFGTDVHILVWETYPYRSPFADVWSVFTRHPLQTLADVRGQRICYRNLVLPLLPRMIFGLYYNTPIIQNCAKSGMFRAFSEHVLHRMRIPIVDGRRVDQKLRITLLSRLTRYRNIENAAELAKTLAKDERFAVQMVSFEKLTFRQQLVITRNTDVFIGMHGAGLTHLLFLPDWASLFELYNCKDESCYRDLARLRGVNYVTWERADKMQMIKRSASDPINEDYEPTLASDGHEKFANYRFEADEFVRLVNVAAEHVWQNREYRAFVASAADSVGESEWHPRRQSDEL